MNRKTMTDTEMLDMVERRRFAINPQLNGGWVITDSDDEQEWDVARTQGTLRDAIKIAVEHIT